MCVCVFFTRAFALFACVGRKSARLLLDRSLVHGVYFAIRKSLLQVARSFMSEDNELGGEDAEGDEVVDGGTSAGESAGDRHDRVTADPDAECGGGDGVHVHPEQHDRLVAEACARVHRLDIGQPESASSMIGQPESPGHTASAETDAVAVAAPASAGGGGGQEDELKRAKARVENGQYASEGYLERASASAETDAVTVAAPASGGGGGGQEAKLNETGALTLVTADPDAECGGGDGVHEESQAEASTLVLAAPDGGRQPPGRSSGELDLPAVDSEWGDVIGQELSAAQFGRAVEWIGARIDGTHAKAVSQRILHLLHAADLHQRTRMLLCTAVTIAVTHATTAGLRDGASVTQQVGAVSGLLKLLNQRPVGTQIAQPLFVNQLVKKANDVPASDEATYLAGLGLELPLSVEDQQRARMRLHIILRNATRGAGCHGRPLTPAEVLQARVDMERAGCLHECKTQGRSGQGRMLTVGYAADGHGTYQIRQQKRRVVAGAPGLCVTSQE